MRFELLLGADEFWDRLDGDIRGARARAYVQAMTCEGDSVGLQLGAALAASGAPDRRLLIDSFSKFMISDKFLLSPSAWFDRPLQAEVRATKQLIDDLGTAGVGVRFTNPVGPLLVNLPCRNHKKIMVIDEDVSYLGGLNFSEHNFAWHDMMLRIEDRRLAELLAEDFAATWAGRNQSFQRSVGPLELFLFDGRASAALYQRVFELIESARESIYVISPYLTFPFTDALRRASARGATVVVIIPGGNNRPVINSYLQREALECGFELRQRAGGMSHLKAMLIDDARLIAGSSNFDFVSYYLEQEVMVVIDDAALARTFRERVLEPDLAQSQPVDPGGVGWEQRLNRRRLQLLGLLCRYWPGGG